MIQINIPKINVVSLLAVGILISLNLMPSKTFAETQTLALACGPNSATAVSTTDGKLSCNGGSAPDESAYVAALGSDSSLYPSDIVITVEKVDCGSKSLAPIRTGSGNGISRIKCAHGASPSVSQQQLITPTGAGTGTCTGGDPNATQALCPYCSSNAPVSGCIRSGNDPAVTCNRGQCDLIQKYLNPFIDLFSVLFGLIAVISLILGGMNFASSEGDPQKAAKAKQRIFNTVFAVVAYIFLFAFLQFLVPGGIFNR